MQVLRVIFVADSWGRMRFSSHGLERSCMDHKDCQSQPHMAKSIKSPKCPSSTSGKYINKTIYRCKFSTMQRSVVLSAQLCKLVSQHGTRFLRRTLADQEMYWIWTAQFDQNFLFTGKCVTTGTRAQASRFPLAYSNLSGT